MKDKYVLPTIDGNEVEIYEVNSQIKIDDAYFEKIETIFEIEEGSFIPEDKIKKYASKGLVKTLSDYTVEDINNKLRFCKFKLTNDKVQDVPGVYIWVAGNEIIYIGETKRLKERFNNGYGIIQPRNIFKGGQSTNCKMNRIVIENIEKGKPITIYFCNTKKNKELEKSLLSKYKPKYNSKR